MNTEPHVPTVIAERLYDRTPAARARRLERLQPDAIRRHITEWRDRHGDPYFAAVNLIEMSRMLELTPTARVAMVDRILDILEEIRSVG